MDLKTAQDWKNYYLQKSLALNTAEKNSNYYLQNYPEDLLHRAWCEEIAKLPLVEQCLQLDITHEKLAGLPYGKKPEIDALNHFSAQGFVGAYCEGGPVLLLISPAASHLAHLHIQWKHIFDFVENDYSVRTARKETLAELVRR